MDLKEIDGDIMVQVASEIVDRLTNLIFRLRIYTAKPNSKEYNLEIDQSSNVCRLNSASSINLALKIFFQLLQNNLKDAIKCPFVPVSISN